MSQIISTLLLIQFVAPLSPPNICRAKASRSICSSFIYVLCRLLTSSHCSLVHLLTRLLLIDSDHIPPPLLAQSWRTSSPHAVKPLYTAPGTLRGPGRSRAAQSHPVWPGPTQARILAAAPLAQAHSDPFPVLYLLGSGRLRSPAELFALADSEPSVPSRHIMLTTAAPLGSGHDPPVCVHALSPQMPMV